jgi:hypothetical protein
MSVATVPCDSRLVMTVRHTTGPYALSGQRP